MDLQNYLQELLTLDCNIQTKLQQLNLVQTRLNLEIKANDIKKFLKEYKEKLNEFKDFSSLLSSSNNDNNNDAILKKDIFIKELQIQNEHFMKIETNFRNLYLNQQKKIENIEREVLLNDLDTDTSSTTSGETRQRNVNKDVLVKQSNEITDSLGELNRLMRSSLNQSKATLNTLETSSRSIRNTHDEFNSMSTNINDSKRLLTKYDQRELTNKLMSFFGLCFFFSVVFYIIWKRLF